MIHHIVTGIDDNLFRETVTVFHDHESARKWYEHELQACKECDCDAHTSNILSVALVSVEMPCIPDHTSEGDVLKVVYKVYDTEIDTCDTKLGDAWFR